MTAHVLPIDSVDLGMLSMALADGNPENVWYFDAETGDVRLSGDWADGYDDEDLEDQGWVLIERAGGRAGFDDMEQFAAVLGDLRARDLLQRALEGKGVFRRFRETLREFPELKEPWLTWVNAREESRAIRWLLDGEYVDELDAEAHFVRLRDAAAAALDIVRGSGGPSFELADTPARWAEVQTLLGEGTAVTLTRDGRAYAVITVFESPQL